MRKDLENGKTTVTYCTDVEQFSFELILRWIFVSGIVSPEEQTSKRLKIFQFPSAVT